MPSITDLREAVEDERRIEAAPPSACQVDAARLLNITPEQLKGTRVQLARIRINDTAIASVDELVNAHR